jgi:hypothetical protein
MSRTRIQNFGVKKLIHGAIFGCFWLFLGLLASALEKFFESFF